MQVETIIRQSINWRFEKIKAPESESMRLFAGISDGIEGLLIEQYGPFILATIYNPNITTLKHRIFDVLTEIFPQKAILIKSREDNEANTFQYLHNQLYGEDKIFCCSEGDWKFEIHTDPRHDYGLYLDTKAARLLLKDIAKRKTVLNLFSYTCAFGIAALSGQASSVTNVDPNKDYLEWGKRNADLNNFVFKKYPDTTQEYLARHLRRLTSGKDIPYDITIVDPPAFLVGRGANRLARNMWPEWMDLLKKGGCKEFIIVINDKSLGRQKDLSQFFREGLGGDIALSAIKQSFDVLGQQLTTDDDPYYFNPAIFYIKR